MKLIVTEMPKKFEDNEVDCILATHDENHIAYCLLCQEENKKGMCKYQETLKCPYLYTIGE